MRRVRFRLYNTGVPRPCPEGTLKPNDTSLTALGFHPLIAEWFTGRYGEPTDIQRLIWPVIGAGGHVLMTAPTGSGKTLAAFLWAINRMLSGHWEAGSLRVLYVSPLKALNNDIRRNLEEPLAEIRGMFSSRGQEPPPIRVMTRSGDTPPSERRKMVHHPPEILVTTPESLNLLLSSPVAGSILDTVQLVILDEIHAVAASKRGTHLMSAVERLTLRAGEFQRVAVSATVKPPDRIAGYIGGFRRVRDGGRTEYRQRNVQIVGDTGKKRYDIRVVFPEKEDESENSIWPSLIKELAIRIRRNTSTLIFVNSRRMAEKTARLLNEYLGGLEAYAHHGSLSRELRSLVEERMKKGELSAVVATGSLELGIDIGDLDEVICLETPFSIAGAVQRGGRSGHGVGEVSRLEFFPLHGMDVLSSVVVAGAVEEGDIEETRIPLNPLDVLAQVILSMTAMEQWDLDELYDFLRTCWSWHRLPRKFYDDVLDMLSGRFADTKIHELSPRIILDRDEGTVEARKGVLPLLYASGGTIPDRGYYQLRLSGSGNLVGELDEEFVWERKINEIFTLGNQSWRITSMNERVVEVVPAGRIEAMTPFWRAEPGGRSFLFCTRIREFLDAWTDGLRDRGGMESVASGVALNDRAGEKLTDFLNGQVEAAGALPGTHRIVVEYPAADNGVGDTGRIIIHTCWGWEVNAPFALALARAWEESGSLSPAVFYTDICVLLDFKGPVEEPDFRNILPPERAADLLRKKLGTTGMFGAVFRENAARALLLPRSNASGRIPLWFTRLRGKKLLEAVADCDNFPVLAETWRSCLEDIFDLPNLTRCLDELADGRMEIETVRTEAPSPFAAEVFYQHTNYFMYIDDTPETGGRPKPGTDYIRDLLSSTELRPRIPREVVAVFERRIQRMETGYTPESAVLVLDFVRQRRFMTEREWRDLAAAVQRDHGLTPDALEKSLQGRIGRFRFPGGTEDLVAVPSEVRKLSGGRSSPDMAALVAERLAWFGPVAPEHIRSVFGLTGDAFENLIDDLIERGEVLPGPVGEAASEGEVCSARSLEILLRLKRRMARISMEPRPVELLAPFLARWSGVIGKGGRIVTYEESLEKLLLYPAEASLWEEDLLPVRIPRYEADRFDALLTETDLLWLGCGKKKLLFSFRDEIHLLGKRGDEVAVSEVFPHPRGAFGFWDLKDYSGLDSGDLSGRLWELAWKGLVTTRGFSPVRRGIASGFKAYTPSENRGTQAGSRRGGFSRWERSRQVSSLWQPVETGEEPCDLIEGEEVNRERVRILLQRYGILSRPLLDREIPDFRWSRLFPSLRLMEFSGEVISGIFFHGLPGPQFATPEAVGVLEDFRVPDTTWWLNAADPASLCGMKPADYPAPLPRRIPSNRLLYHGDTLVMTMLKNGRELHFHRPPEDPLCGEAFVLFTALLGRNIRPLSSIKTETVNGVPVPDSPYLPVLQSLGFERAYRGYVLRRKV